MVEDKTAILDVRAKTEDGTQINIEVQLTNQRNMEKRTLFYWRILFNEGINKGEDYRDLSKVITINILDFIYLELNKFHSKFHLWEDEKETIVINLLNKGMDVAFISEVTELSEKEIERIKKKIN